MGRELIAVIVITHCNHGVQLDLKAFNMDISRELKGREHRSYALNTKSQACVMAVTSNMACKSKESP